jgi:hypothetical protein
VPRSSSAMSESRLARDARDPGAVRVLDDARDDDGAPPFMVTRDGTLCSANFPKRKALIPGHIHCGCTATRTCKKPSCNDQHVHGRQRL